MQDLHEHNTLMVNVRTGYDPTRTTVLRNTMVRESNRRFDYIAKLIKKAVDDEDLFGLSIQTNQTPGQNAFAFKLNIQKVEEFNRWLQEQVMLGIIDITEIPRVGTSIVDSWTNKYIVESYQRGVRRARQEMIRAGYVIPLLEATGGILGAMAVPLHVDAVGLLYIRMFNELRGITDQMEQYISRLLAQGLIDGVNPKILAQRLIAAINGAGGDLSITDTLGRFIPAKRRAEIMVRTELIRAHHYATINEYKNWGVLGVNVMAEFKTAGDDRVCNVCNSLEGQIFTLDEILPMIPVHPQCRCVALPLIYETKNN
jgi:SPP1 gp7 family putative phage head morphogenesis protein